MTITDYLKRLMVVKLGTSDDESSAIIANIVNNGASSGGVAIVPCTIANGTITTSKSFKEMEELMQNNVVFGVSSNGTAGEDLYAIYMWFVDIDTNSLIVGATTAASGNVVSLTGHANDYESPVEFTLGEE